MILRAEFRCHAHATIYLRTINRGSGNESESPVRRCFIIHLRGMTAVIAGYRSPPRIARDAIGIRCMHERDQFPIDPNVLFCAFHGLV